MLTREPPSDSPSPPGKEGRSRGNGSHDGLFNSGMGLALNSRLHWRAVQRAHFFDFFRRALSVEIPVPAYICRYSLERNTKASRDLKLGQQAERSQIAGQA